MSMIIFRTCGKKFAAGILIARNIALCYQANHEHVERLDRRLGWPARFCGEHRHICGLGAHDV
jgi:hypothetical protein